MNITKEDAKRILCYCVVVICCLFVGGFIAIDYLDASIDNLKNILYCKDIILYIFLVVVSYFMFLIQYVLRYNAKNNTKVSYVAYLQVIMCIIILLNNFDSMELIKWITLLLSLISFMGIIFYHHLSNISLNIVRYELVWPSIFIVALPIYIGYSVVISGIAQNTNYDVMIYYVVFILYSIAVFYNMGSDKEKAKSVFYQKEHERKRKDKSIWYIHLVALITILWLIYEDPENAIITFLCVCICSVMTIFETWYRNWSPYFLNCLVCSYISSKPIN